MAHGNERMFSNRGLICSLFGACLLGAVAVFGGLTVGGLVDAMGRVPPWLYPAVALLQAAIIALAAIKWKILLARSAGHDAAILPFRSALSATSLGVLVGQVLPLQLVTPMIRAWAARPHGIPAGRAIGTSLFEQLFEVVVLLAMGLVAVLLLKTGAPLSVTLALGLGCIAATTLLIRPCLILLDRAFRWASGWLARRMAAVAMTLADAASGAARLPVIILTYLSGLSFLRYGLMTGLNAIILFFVVPDVDLHTVLIAFPLVLLLMSLPIVPGGLGIVEGTWVGTFVAQGIPLPDAVEAALALRVISTGGFLIIAPLLIAVGHTQRQGLPA